MQHSHFHTSDGTQVPAVTTQEMKRIDQIAVEEFELSLLQMMEHAGRTLASLSLGFDPEAVTVFAGRGGNGGGGLACARHLANRGRLHSVVCSREREAFSGAAANQLNLLDEMDVPINFNDPVVPDTADLLVDSLVGYGLTGSPRDIAADLIKRINESAAPVVSLDVPSGVDATTGETPGAAVDATRTLTLALPKTGLIETKSRTGEIVLGDLGIPAAVFKQQEIEYNHPFGDQFCIELNQ